LVLASLDDVALMAERLEVRLVKGSAACSDGDDVVDLGDWRDFAS
jgi:hypothetical protein